MRAKNSIVRGSILLTLIVWTFLSRHWWAHFEGDSPIYSLMSLDVLEGKHYLVTPGQAHGGTPLVYVRAALFWLFGPSPFLGFFSTGLAVAAAVGLWVAFAYELAGPLAGALMGSLGAIGSERFARAACTDYFILTLVMAGIMLNLAKRLAGSKKKGRALIFATGLTLGFSWYVCRFSALYAVASGVFFVVLSPPSQRAELLPSLPELKDGLSKFWVGTIALMALLTGIAFFTSDRFLGIDAERNLKMTMFLALGLWARHRWRLVVNHASKIAVFLVGAVVGLLPEIAIRFLPHSKDRVTGLVRWGDIVAKFPQLRWLMGLNFSFYHPLDLGIVAGICALIVLMLGFFSKRKKLYAAAFFPAVLCLMAWFSIHTYMHLVPNYFFTVYFPLYLAMACAVALTRYQKAALIALIPFIAIALNDHRETAFLPNQYEDSGLIALLEKWNLATGARLGFGDYPSHLDITWASRARFKFPTREEETRFPAYRKAIDREPRIFYVRHRDDIQPAWEHLGWRLLDHAELSHGFSAQLLERASH